MVEITFDLSTFVYVHFINDEAMFLLERLHNSILIAAMCDVVEIVPGIQ